MDEVMEKILEINEISFKTDEDSWSEKDGFEIITDKQTIKMGISNSQSCCENWGYLLSEDDLGDFIGAQLISVSITDTQLEKIDVPTMDYGGDAMFVNIVTSEGLLQFVAYNQHNGYYGHEAVVISNELNVSEYL